MTLGTSLFVGTADATVNLVEREPAVKRPVIEEDADDVDVGTMSDTDVSMALVTPASAMVVVLLVRSSSRAAYRPAQASAPLGRSPS